MADLGELYGIPADAPPVQLAAAKRAADVTGRLRAQAHAPVGPAPTLADAETYPGVLARGEVAAAQQEAEEAAWRAENGVSVGGPQVQQQAGPGDTLGQMRDASQDRALGIAGQLDRGYKTVKGDRAMYEPTKQWISESDAVNAQRMQNAEGVQTQEAGMLRDRAQMADEAHAATARMEARQMFLAEQQARKRADIEDSVAQYGVAADEAAKEFAKTEQFSPGKAWADKSAGTKVRIFLAALGRGLSGGKPSDIFSEVLQRELAAHKQTRADAGEKLGAARASRDNATKRMQSFLALTQDERVADKMVEMTTLRGLDTKMAAMEAEGKADLGDAAWKNARADIQQRMADTDLAIREREANNPKHTYRRVDQLGRNTRRVMGKIVDSEVDAMGEAGKQFAGMQRDAAKASVASAEKGAARSGQDRKWLAEKTGDVQERIQSLELFKKKYGDDIPGKSALSWVPGVDATAQILSKDARQAKRLLKRDMMKRLRKESGAATPDYEIEREAEDIIDGMTEDDVMAEIDNRLAEDRRKLDLMTRGVSTETEGEYLARPVDARAALRQGGGGGGGPASLVLDE